VILVQLEPFKGLKEAQAAQWFFLDKVIGR
jgi:hypothetical protein